MKQSVQAEMLQYHLEIKKVVTLSLLFLPSLKIKK